MSLPIQLFHPKSKVCYSVTIFGLVTFLCLVFCLPNLANARLKESKEKSNSISLLFKSHSDWTLKDIRILTLDEDLKPMKGFVIPKLSTEQEALVKIPSDRLEAIRIIHQSTSTSCQYFSRPISRREWPKHDTIYLTEKGSSTASYSITTPSNVILELIHRSCDSDEMALDGTKTTYEVVSISNSQKKGPKTTEEYIGFVTEAAMKNWNAPPSKSQMIPIVSFLASKNGEITKIRLKQSSRDLALDESCLQAIKSLVKLPPFPRDLARSSVNIEIEFDRRNTKKQKPLF